MKSPKAVVLIFILFGTFMIACNFPIGLAKSGGVNVYGNISKNTTWTLTNSPYNLTGNVTVDDGATLTIDAGVSVVSKNNYGDGQGGVFFAALTINGTLTAIGSTNNPITFNDTQITFSPSTSGWNPQTNSGSIIEKCYFVDTELYLTSSPKVDSNVFTGEESTIVVDGGSSVISGNYMTNNSMSDAYGWNGNVDIEIKDANNATITGNTIDDGMYGIVVDIQISGFSFDSLSGTTTIENDLITNNKGAGISCGTPFPLIIKNNTITLNYIGLDLDAFSNKSVVADNNIYNNTGIYGNFDPNVDRNISLGPGLDINASYNWWGTTNSTAISQPTSDFPSEPPLLSPFSTVTFDPILNSPNIQAPAITSANPLPINISSSINEGVSGTAFRDLIYATILALVAVIAVLSLVALLRRRTSTDQFFHISLHKQHVHHGIYSRLKRRIS